MPDSGRSACLKTTSLRGSAVGLLAPLKVSANQRYNRTHQAGPPPGLLCSLRPGIWISTKRAISLEFRDQAQDQAIAFGGRLDWT